MFDVVMADTCDNEINFYCYLDHEETELNKKIKNLIQNIANQNPIPKNDKDLIIDFFKSLYFVKNDNFALFIQNQKRIDCFTSNTKIKMVSITLFSPPPQYC
jgi:hypothetical protein